MAKMKTFLIYLLILIAFFIVSNILEDGLIKNMYYNMDGDVDESFSYNGYIMNMDLEVTEAKCTRRNGYIILNVTNNSEVDISEAYIKVELYSKSDVLAITKYMEIDDLNSGESKSYKLRFSGSYINEYSINFENEYPDKHYIINVFGYDINTSNVLGLGIDISEFVNADNFKSLGSTIFNSISVTIQRVPWWGWMWAWLIIVGVW